MRKFLSYILILVVLAGLGMAPIAQAVGTVPVASDGSCPPGYKINPNNPKECYFPDTGNATPPAKSPYQVCIEDANATGKSADTCRGLDGDPSGASNTSSDKSEFNKAVNDEVCLSLWTPPFIAFDGCILKLLYYVFFQIASFILYCVAYLFNVVISVTINGSFLQATFISDSWGVVRDLSNLFFIIILIYIGIKVILGLGGHDVKSMVVKVVIMALLINFSMFFTKVVIDTSNVLALVFYNKINVERIGKNPRPYADATGEKDVAGGLVQAFDPTRLLSADFLNNQGASIAIPGYPEVKGRAPTSILIGVTLLTIILMLCAAYSLFVTAFSFLGRLIELFVLIIFSPFAFMSFVIPKLGHLDYIGWDYWSKSLIKVSFMAPIFMFFLYFIFKIVQANPFGSIIRGTGYISLILSIFIPAILILTLLIQATKFAEKGSGVIGDKLATIGKVVAGVAAGGAIGGAASLLQGTAGHAGKLINESKTLTDADARGNFLARGLRNIGGAASKSSFDARKGVVGAGLKFASTATGFNLGTQSKFLLKEEGGYEADLKRRDAKRKARAESLKVKEGEPEKQHLNEMKEGLQTVSLANDQDLHDKDREIKGAEAKVQRLREIANASNNMGKIKIKNEDGSETERYVDPEHETKQREWADAAAEVKKLYADKSNIKNGSEITKIDEATGREVGTGVFRTHNGKISEQAVANINLEADAAEEAQRAAEAAAAAAPALHDAAVTAKTAADAAVTAAESEVFRAKLDPTNPAALEAANKAKEAAVKLAARAEKEVAQTLANTTDAAKKVVEATTKATELAAKANRANNLAKRGTGYSQNEFEDRLIPKAEHAVKHVNDRRTRDYANTVENQIWPWNAAARKKSAHDIRMGVKAEKSHGGGHHGGIGEELIAAVAAETLVGGGHHGSGDHGHAAAATDSHGAKH